MNKMHIYNEARAVPKEAQKNFNNGKFSGTDINPMWRIKKLTELFGACGVGWYYDVISERAEEHGGMTIAVVDLNLYVNIDGEWSKPIYGTGGNVIVNAKGNVSDEGYKMALTDALSVACKALGVGADIYFSNDKTKYTAQGAETSKNVKNDPINAPKNVPAPAMPAIDYAAARKRLDEIVVLLTNGKVEDMRSAYHFWTDKRWVELADIPDAEIPNVLTKAESIYRKRNGVDYAPNN